MSGQVMMYVDGACKGNPGPGGWAAILQCGEHTKELVGGADHTTNNRMELQAVIEGLKALKKRSVVKLVTDSQYVIQMLKGARAKANQDLVEELRQLAGQHQVQAQWVKGHSGLASASTVRGVPTAQVMNELADELASREAAHRQQMVEAGWGDETVPQATRLVMATWRPVGGFIPQIVLFGCTAAWVGYGVLDPETQTVSPTACYTVNQPEYAPWVRCVNQLHERQRLVGAVPGLSEAIDLVPLPPAEQPTDPALWLAQLAGGGA